MRISRELIDQILAEARGATEREICGLLLGRSEGEIELVTAARPAANVSDAPARRFEIDPSALIAAYRQARAGGPAVLGHYHSHPHCDVAPSRCDAEMAIPDGAIWLICASDGSFACWRAGERGLHGRFAKCDVTIDERSPCPLHR